MTAEIARDRDKQWLLEGPVFAARAKFGCVKPIYKGYAFNFDIKAQIKGLFCRVTTNKTPFLTQISMEKYKIHTLNVVISQTVTCERSEHESVTPYVAGNT